MTDRKKPPPTQRDNEPSLPTRDSEERKRPEDRQYDKRNEHPLNEDPDIPGQPRR